MARKKYKIPLIILGTILLIGIIGYIINIQQNVVIFKPTSKPVLLNIADIVRQNTDTELFVTSDYIFDEKEVSYGIYLDDNEAQVCQLQRIVLFGAGSQARTVSYKCTIKGDLLNELGNHKITFVFGNRYSDKMQCCLLSGQSTYNKLKSSDSRLLNFKNLCLNNLEQSNQCSKNNIMWRDTQEGLLDVYGPTEFSPETLFSTSISFKVIKEEEFDKIIPTATTTFISDDRTTTTTLKDEIIEEESNLPIIITIILTLLIIVIIIYFKKYKK